MLGTRGGNACYCRQGDESVPGGSVRQRAGPSETPPVRMVTMQRQYREEAEG